MEYLNNKKILITGGTGTFGNAFIKRVLEEKIKKVYVFSRDECKQWKMSQKFNDDRVQYLIGDIRDKDRLYRAFEGIDYVIHAAAQKHVPSCEYNPFEAINTNILGSQNIINAAIDRGVKKVLAISTDKAVLPINLYGCTKAVMEKLFIYGNNYSGSNDTKFSCVRYGNVIGSRGSVVELWRKQLKENGNITLTDLHMTRFWITIESAVYFVLQSLNLMKGEEIFVPEVRTMELKELALMFTSFDNIEITGKRQGEKLHEVLISREETQRALKIKDFKENFFKIYKNSWELDKDYDNWEHKESMIFYNSNYDSSNKDNILTIEEMRNGIL
jgi:UDP-N-acetylglucosamine 4,6-dehydratase